MKIKGRKNKLKSLPINSQTKIINNPTKFKIF